MQNLRMKEVIIMNMYAVVQIAFNGSMRIMECTTGTKDFAESQLSNYGQSEDPMLLYFRERMNDPKYPDYIHEMYIQDYEKQLKQTLQYKLCQIGIIL